MRPWRPSLLPALLAGLLLLPPLAARAQPIDLAHGGPVEITAADGIEWHQNERTVVARGAARAVRGDVTVTADRLIAYYRRRAEAPARAEGAAARPASLPGAAPGPSPGPGPAPAPALGPGPAETGDNEIYRLEAQGHVHIYTPTDDATGERAIYDIDQAVMVMTGGNLRLTTPQDTITARDSLEYWSQKHMAVARGDATVTTSDARQLTADTIVAYMRPADQPAPAKTAAAPAPAPAGAEAPGSGKLDRVEVFGNVVIRTPTQMVRGERGVYLHDRGIARMVGNTRLTQGQNQVNGAGLDVDLNTGVYRLVSAPHDRVQGVVVPNDAGAGGDPHPTRPEGKR